MKRLAFTLSELLIALSVVGIVAILTVPNVSKNVYTKANITKLETTMKSINDAVKAMMVNERVTDVADSTLATDPLTFFNKYMLLTSNTGCAETTDCFVSSYKTISSDTTSISDFQTAMQLTTATYVMLKTGAAVALLQDGSAGYFFVVDVNSTEKPNVVGRDLFALSLDPEQGTVYGGGAEEDDCKNGTYLGSPCVTILQENNWEMNY
ncbi:type II secretion system protein [bacterium]|nr:type II secretion system protein [bacterium]